MGMKRFLAACTACGVLLASWATQAAKPLVVVEAAESNERFSKARIVGQARVGKGAFAIDVPAGKTAFFPIRIDDVDIDLADYAGLAFWWRVEGEGLKTLTVKTRFPTMSEGRQLVMPLWRLGQAPVPRDWASGVVLFSQTQGAHGDPSGLKIIEFRTQAEEGAEVTLYIDHIVALPGAFEMHTGVAHRKGDQWVAPLRLTSLASGDLDVTLGAGDEALRTVALAGGGEAKVDLPLPVGADALGDAKPLDRVATEVWAQIGDEEITRHAVQLHVYKPLPLPPNPRLMVDAAQIAEIKRRIEKHEWAAQRWSAEKKNADAILKREIDIPPRGGQSGNSYANPKTGGRLHAGKKIGPYKWEHVDKATGDVFLGDPTSESTDYDAVKIGSLHMQNARHAETLGLVYLVTNEEKYAQKAREIVVRYGEKFLDYPLDRYGDDKTHGKGRVTANYLTEAHWVIYMASVIDMIWDVLTEDERAMLAEKMLYPALRDSIRPVRCYVHNIQCWKNSAKMLTGLLYDDPELIHSALYDPAEGYWKQLEEGVLPGGVWYEGSWGYHFYTMSAIVPLTEAARHCGMDLYVEKLKAMYLAPTQFVMPDMRLPNFNDAGLMDLSKLGSRYELAAARWDEPLFRQMLGFRSRVNRDALLHGIDAEIPKTESLPIASANYEGAGYAVLARGEGRDATWLSLKYSPPSKYHGHPDRLHFILYSRGEMLAIDPGSVAYYTAIQKEWYKTTLAHNTLMVDEESQVKAAGNCIDFGTRDGVDYVMLDDGEAIAEARFVRTAALVDENLVVFIDQVRSDAERVLDFAYHPAGEWLELPQGNPGKPPTKPPYRYLTHARQWQATAGLTVSTKVAEGLTPAIAVAAGDPTYAIAATGPGIGGASNRVPCLVLRRKEKQTALGWAVAIDGRAPKLELVGVKGPDGKAPDPSQAVALRVGRSDGSALTVVANPDALDLEGTGRERFAVTR